LSSILFLPECVHLGRYTQQEACNQPGANFWLQAGNDADTASQDQQSRSRHGEIRCRNPLAPRITREHLPIQKVIEPVVEEIAAEEEAPRDKGRLLEHWPLKSRSRSFLRMRQRGWAPYHCRAFRKWSGRGIDARTVYVFRSRCEIFSHRKSSNLDQPTGGGIDASLTNVQGC
jgi:hypothetical protein